MEGRFRLWLVAAVLAISAFVVAGCNPGKIDIILSPAVLPDGQVGQFYRVKFTASGGTRPYTYLVPTQGIPPGLAFAQVTSTEALLEGTPQRADEYVFQVGVCDAVGKCVARGYLLKILSPQP